MKHSVNKKSAITFRKVAPVLLVVIIVSLIFIIATYFDNDFDKKNENDSNAIATIDYQGKTYELNQNVETLLILGLDKYEDNSVSGSARNDEQNDFNLLLSINNETKQVTPVLINRDTMVNMDVLGIAGDTINTTFAQLALSHTYGDGNRTSCRNSADAVSTLFKNVLIDNYVSLTMNAVPVLNDMVDGVEVTVKDDFSGIDETLIKGQTVLLKGQHALNYVRGRYSVGNQTNAERMIRQQEYLKSLYEKMVEKSRSSETFIASCLSRINDDLVSNLDVNELQTLGKKIEEYKLNECLFLDGKYQINNGYLEFYPDENDLLKITVDLFYE